MEESEEVPFSFLKVCKDGNSFIVIFHDNTKNGPFYRQLDALICIAEAYASGKIVALEACDLQEEVFNSSFPDDGVKEFLQDLEHADWRKDGELISDYLLGEHMIRCRGKHTLH